MFNRAALVGGLIVAVFAPTVPADEIRFNRDVRPILASHCFKCHGPDSGTREADLRLDDRDSAIEKRDGRPAISPGTAASSELIHRVSTDNADIRMPPEGEEPLTDEQIQTLTEWVEQGAEYEPHWAFMPVARPDVPSGGDGHPIDAFVAARLKHVGVRPARTASRETLIRRVAFDLTGLPPTIAEIDRFLTDKSDNAYEAMVDRYLASTAYGEHMARHWLDLARYADTNGYQYDTERQQWVWRDWVIDAYNRNLPFDQFTVEQLAGDLLPDASPQQRLATGFNRNHAITIEGGIIDEEYRTEYVMDRVVTTGQAWLALTVGCARCHDHKFDPLSQKEFYGLYAFFNQVPDRGMRGFAPQERIPSPLQSEQQRSLDAELARLRALPKEPANLEALIAEWAEQLTKSPRRGWQTLAPRSAVSSGGSTLTPQQDHSVVAGGANPRHDVYTIEFRTDATRMTAFRLEALTHKSLPGGGPGRHSNSNFVLSEFEASAVSEKDPNRKQVIQFSRAVADYSQKSYEIDKAIDGTAAGNNGWAVDGPTRKQPATAMFIAKQPFGFEGGTQLTIRLRHEAGFATHGIGRPRLSITGDAPEQLQLKGVPARIRTLAAIPASQRSPEQTGTLKAWFLQHHNPNRAVEEKIAALEKQRAAATPATMIMQDMPRPRTTHILDRGQYNQPGDAVTAAVPGILPRLPKGAAANRLGFARWLTDPAHPLTARVAVNRYWQRVFGIGLVRTSEDFGIQGELPSHPYLLDWLASEFVRTGWDVKRMHRLILTSHTYRQTSHVGSESYRRDPENRLLARGPRLRLDAEEVRDATLSVAGLLVTRVGGPSVYPYQPAGLWLELNNRPGYSRTYPQGKGDDLYRRSVYTFWKRTVPSPMLKTFDAPEREFCTSRRSRTNTPLQALMLLNAPQFVEGARQLGHRMMLQPGNLDARLTWGFRVVTARRPSAEELAILREAWREEQHRFSSDPEAAMRLLAVGESKAASENQAHLSAFASVARLLLNLNEAITRG